VLVGGWFSVVVLLVKVVVGHGVAGVGVGACSNIGGG